MTWNVRTRSIASVAALLMLSRAGSAQTYRRTPSEGSRFDTLMAGSRRRLETEQVTNRFIKELGRFAGQQPSSEGLDFATWRSRTIADLEQWLARIVLPQL